MTTERIAIGCQGGGINAAFTYGVLRKVLQTQQLLAEQNAAQRFQIAGLSGTSAGALCAFMAWYGLASKAGRPGSIEQAIAALDRLWDTFSAQTPGEKLVNTLGVQGLKLQSKGLPEIKMSPYSLVSELAMNELKLMGLRPEFYDFAALLNTCAPDLSAIDQKAVDVRLLIGAVEVLSGRFQAFDSMTSEAESEQTHISYQAVRASGTLPELRKAEEIKVQHNGETKSRYYWDGLWSQNPPLREFLTDVGSVGDKPDEIWIVRINPQERDELPKTLEDIEDRRNELSGNVSLNQELQFIQTVNRWVERYPDAFGERYKTVKIRTIKISKSTSDRLGVPSKFNREPGFIQTLRQEGEAVAAAFLAEWPETGEWPDDAVYR